MTRIAPLGIALAAPSTEADAATIERAVKIAIEALKEQGVRDDYTVLVGGGPFDAQSALAAGADAYCGDGSAPAEMAKAFMTRQ